MYKTNTRMLTLCCWCVLLVVSVDADCHKGDPVVTLKQGRLKGTIKNLLDGSEYYSFKGIPYAEPPIGDRRFMAPFSPKPWQGTYDATNHGPACPQYDITTEQYVEGSENCLFLNVYTKSLKTKSKIPVMLFIHGGGFMSGRGDADYGFGPEFLLPHNVILVTINYRLEVLGFLCLDTPEVPGNAGMRDQVAALRWVKRNIVKFGGDPDNVTIFGESSGASAITYHLLSPMSTGLFHKAIAQSGEALSVWNDGISGRERAFRAGKALGKDTENVTELLEFLRSLPAIQLTNVNVSDISQDEIKRGGPAYFIPIVEKKLANVEPFLPKKPIDLLLEGKVNKAPFMLGYNSVEGLYVLQYALTRINFTNHNPQYLVPRELAQAISLEKTKEFGERIKNYYAANNEFTENDAVGIANMLSDMDFVYNIHRFAYFYSSLYKSTYMYRFSADTDLNIVKILSGASQYKGASHGDELFYIFYSGLNKDPYLQDSLKEIVFRVSKLWTDFAKTSNPTPDNASGVKWIPYTQTSKDFLDINEMFTPGQFAERDRVKFWNQLFTEAGLPHITK